LTDLSAQSAQSTRSQTSPVDPADYEALRSSVGAVVLERDALVVSGKDALVYLQGQCSQDLTGLAVGQSTDSLVLEPQGKLDALVRVTRSGDDSFVVDVAVGYGEALRIRLKRFMLRVKAEIGSLSWRCVALRGDSAASVVPPGSTHPGAELVVPYSWNGIQGVDLLGPGPGVPDTARVCTPEALHVLRVEAGVPEMGSELDERTIPAEAGLLERCVSFTKGCYTGQELVARLDARGNRVARRLRGIVFDESVPPEAAFALVRAQVQAGEKPVGVVTSACWSPALKRVAALGYLHRDVVPPARLSVRVGGSLDRDGGTTGPSATGGEAAEGGPLSAEARELPLVLPVPRQGADG
jgi:tRNA-modifying protein YgfZ